MNRFSPKIEIINHYDNLINRVDIEIEKCLEKCKKNQLLKRKERYDRHRDSILNPFESLENLLEKKYSTVYLWSKSTKVVDYLNQVRMRTIEELRKEQNEALEYYKHNSSKFQEQLKDETEIEELKSKLFGEKFYFQLVYRPFYKYSGNWIFNLFTICVDFYMSQDEINLLEYIINSSNPEINLYRKNYILDEKMVLINLILKTFIEYLKNEKFPNQSICVRREDVHSIYFNYALSGVNLTSSTIDLSKLEKLEIVKASKIEEIKIENLSSLKYLSLKIESIERVTLNNLLSLRDFHLILKEPETINSKILDKFVDILPSIEKLSLSGDLSYFNLDHLFRLKTLILWGKMQKEEFNYFLFKNLCEYLTSLTISISNFDDKSIEKLFYCGLFYYGLHFPNISYLRITFTRISILEKKFFDGFPNLQSLKISHNKQLIIIDPFAFYSLKQLRNLNLSENFIESLEKGHFSELSNLETLDLSGNRIKTIEENTFSTLNSLKKLDLSSNQIAKLHPKSFVDLRNLKELDLNFNNLRDFDIRTLKNINEIENIYIKLNSNVNKDEILFYFKNSKIKFHF